MRRLFFQVFIDIRTQPESHDRATKKSAVFEAGVLRLRFRVRRERRTRMGIKAKIMRDQSKAMKPARVAVSFVVED